MTIELALVVTFGFALVFTVLDVVAFRASHHVPQPWWSPVVPGSGIYYYIKERLRPDETGGNE